MATEGTSALAGWSSFELVRWGREIVQHEAQTLLALADTLDQDFAAAAQRVFACEGSIVVSGMGKAGLIGQKISATLCSTGTRSHFLHPAEALHGDLGRVAANDVALVLSQSGETAEITRLLPALQSIGAAVIAITGRRESSLGKAAEIVLELGNIEESGPNRLAPSASTTAMLAVGDALALAVSRAGGFRPEDFVKFHPGGSLGLRLSLVDDVLRGIDQCRVALESQRVRDVFVVASRPGRRTGAIMLTDEQGRLTGFFTDSDLARLLEHRKDDAIDQPIREVMTPSPVTVKLGTPLPHAVDLMAARKISELPVVDEDGKPLGIIDVTDVLSLLPHESGEPSATKAKERAITLPFRNDRS